MMPWACQHVGVGQAAGDVGLPQALVKNTLEV
jgi:hypothetical protein